MVRREAGWWSPGDVGPRQLSLARSTFPGQTGLKNHGKGGAGGDWGC